MTIWDSIYKKYQKGGEAWATLSEDIHPLFKRFLSQTNFSRKYALDIGCGTGKYVKLLHDGGFKTDGIDSSETAVEMTKKTLGDGSLFVCENMFEFDIPKGKYDLVISISTIHHGTKEQVQNLIHRIYGALVENGKIFITVPDFESAVAKGYVTDDQYLGDGTYAPISGPEKGLPHSHYTKEEVQRLFSQFSTVILEIDEVGRWVVQASK